MTKQDKGFRDSVREQVFQLAGSASMCWEPKPEGVFDSTQAAKFADEATDRIVSLVRELVPDDVDDGSDTDRLIGFNRCRTEILSRLEDGK